MALSPRLVAPLLFGSGFCALIYQVTWTREFRLIFGASTAASAAVLAIFVGGLGVGGLWLGGRADQRRRPLELYAQLEALVAVLAAVTPLLLWLARKLYTALGGTVTLGLVGGTGLRLVLATLVLAGPTVAMGGTLPAAVRAVSSAADKGRQGAALLYGVNTLGAVTGSVLSTFVLLEVFGAHLTLWMACLVNLLVAVLALRLSREDDEDARAGKAGADPTSPEAASADAAAEVEAPLVPAAFTLGAAAATGFAFFLLELVWYRMLGPILGGSVFTFGLILAVALLGIGVGGAVYGSRPRGTPSAMGFAATCLLESALVMVPFALGDRVAATAQTLRGLLWMGFSGQVLGWMVVTAVVVLPAALVSGYQFPMLIALLGRGSDKVGRQVGLTYAFNTAGAVLGSLAGGFGLVPLLGAKGCWRLGALTLAGLGVGAVAAGLRRGLSGVWAPAALLLGGLALQTASGPSSLWRHGSIGAGRGPKIDSLQSFEAARRRLSLDVLWERDGVESSVALNDANAYSFIVNGKSDGNSVDDAATQVMSGLLGVAIHPDARRGLVIGLGTGSTAGWLGAVPTMERVDVVEIEPAIVPVARDCAAVNQHVLDQSKVHLLFADAREVLLSSPERYDIVFSEPSNPYRAGIASLFTQEFYQAASSRLAPRGVFLQWVQGYEISPQTVRTILNTLHSVFPVVDIWVLESNDLLMAASHEPHPFDLDRTRALVASEPMRSAMANTWLTAGVDGLLSHHLASPALTDLIARQEGDAINSDDLSPVEFGFARTAGRQGLFDKQDLENVARSLGLQRPLLGQPERVDAGDVELEHAYRRFLFDRQPPSLDAAPAGPWRQRLEIILAYQAGQSAEVRRLWSALPSGTSLHLAEQVLVADSLAHLGDPQADALLGQLAPVLPLEATLLRAELQAAQKHPDEAVGSLLDYLRQHQQSPWVWPILAQRPLQLAARLGSDPARGARLLPAMLVPFAAAAQGRARQNAAVELAMRQPDPALCVQALAPFEPRFPWTESLLRDRLTCYERAKNPLAARARDELLGWLEQRELPFDAGFPEALARRSPAPTPRSSALAARSAAPAVSSSAPAVASSASAPRSSASATPSSSRP